MRAISSSNVAFRRSALALIAMALCGYGYGQEQDPFVDAWKLVASQANQGHWVEARADAAALEAGLGEIESGLGWSLRQPLASALAAREAGALARELTISACGALLWKLEASRRPGLTDYYAAKYRVLAARAIYAELLAPAVRHQDVTRRTSAHETVLAGFARAQSALGRPGFLGRGRVPFEPTAFSAAETEVETALRAVFPFVPEVKR